jgi:hypothetical protein
MIPLLFQGLPADCQVIFLIQLCYAKIGDKAKAVIGGAG